ncbi:MAG TPA: ZIP family metal transporter [Candidatus Nanoarchaeia archaeon]|nr:ZIP family metal transporter [Candidatus Nanoarchaeia archaeon]
MEEVITLTLLSVVIVSLLSVVVALPFLMKKKLSQHTLLILLSMSVGVLLSTVFLDFMPEIVEHGYSIAVGTNILLGFLIFFLLEKFVHWHHHSKQEKDDVHGHAYHLAAVNLIGDGIHNFLDGMVIAGSYAVNIVLGLAATISVIFHELPQELADMGVLLYSGLSRSKSLIFNFISAITAIIGALVGIVLASSVEGFVDFVVPFSAGAFLYISASNVLPQLHRHYDLKESLVHIAAIVFGILIIVAVTLLGPGHGV